MLLNIKIMGNKVFEIRADRAKCAINLLYDINTIKWFNILFDILYKHKYAKARLINGYDIDVSEFANTYKYASFFDVYNHIELIDFNFYPIEKSTLDEKNYYDNILLKKKNN